MTAKIAAAYVHPPSKFLGNISDYFCAILLTNQTTNQWTHVKTLPTRQREQKKQEKLSNFCQTTQTFLFLIHLDANINNAVHLKASCWEAPWTFRSATLSCCIDWAEIAHRGRPCRCSFLPVLPKSVQCFLQHIRSQTNPGIYSQRGWTTFPRWGVFNVKMSLQELHKTVSRQVIPDRYEDACKVVEDYLAKTQWCTHHRQLIFDFPFMPPAVKLKRHLKVFLFLNKCIYLTLYNPLEM